MPKLSFGRNYTNFCFLKVFVKGVAEQLRTGGDSDGKDEDMDTDQPIVLSRDRCLSVVRGLMALLLSMDFTCHVDLFLVACKVCQFANFMLTVTTVLNCRQVDDS